MARTKQVTWTTHRIGGHVVHADSEWANGNSAVGLAIAVRKHERGEPAATDVPGGAHVVHSARETCGHCPKAS
jgi:hypothetical protein